MAGRRTHSGRNGTDYDHNGSVVLGGATTDTVGFYGIVGADQADALTAAKTDTVDNTYGQQENDVITNLRTRVNEIEDALVALGLLAEAE
jgi:hypothetical protein